MNRMVHTTGLLIEAKNWGDTRISNSGASPCGVFTFMVRQFNKFTVLSSTLHFVSRQRRDVEGRLRPEGSKVEGQAHHK